jgi:hypothetical protein
MQRNNLPQTLITPKKKGKRQKDTPADGESEKDTQDKENKNAISMVLLASPSHYHSYY